MNDEKFDFEAERNRWPEHWDTEPGWPTVGSTWRARRFPQLRVRVSARDREYIRAMIFWDGEVDELRRLFSHEPSERWEISKNGLVHLPEGIGPIEEGPVGEDRYWHRDDWLLDVLFERPMFGGPDTWHAAREPWEALPFFEPIKDWDL